MITLSNNTKSLALLHQVEGIYGKVYTSDSLLEMVLYWGINCIRPNTATFHVLLLLKILGVESAACQINNSNNRLVNKI